MLECSKGSKKASVAGIEGATWTMLRHELRKVTERTIGSWRAFVGTLVCTLAKVWYH